MALPIDDLVHFTRKLSNGVWVVARPLDGPYWARVKDALGVLLGHYDAVRYEDQ